MSFLKSTLLISAVACYSMVSPVQADEVKTAYTGLSCVPHAPQPGPNNYDYIYEYYGSDIINTKLDETDSTTGETFYQDLGVNCGINRTLFGRGSKLKSVSVLLSETDPTTWVDENNVAHGNSNCHTHVEYLTAGSVDVILGTDVYTTPGSVGSFQKLQLPAADVAPTNDANYNIHCHIYGNDARINGYTAVEKD